LFSIRYIFFSHNVSSQDDLLSLLVDQAVAYTDTTFSRDLKFLKVNKISDNEKGYIYELPDQHSTPGHELAESYAAQGFVSIKFANKLGVIRTLPGYAPSIASLIDQASPFEIIGTLAGDDTILLIPHENVSEQDIINALIIIVPELKNKIK